MWSNGNSFSNGQSMEIGTERECPFIARLLRGHGGPPVTPLRRAGCTADGPGGGAFGAW